MWGILVFIIIIALIMNSKKEKQSIRQTGKTSVPLARVRFAEIEYDDFVKNNTFKLVHQVDATELEYMDADERREALEDAGLDPDDYDFD